MTHKTPPRRRTLGRLAALSAMSALALLTAPALAQDNWPNRPVRLIVPFPAGGSTDIVARAIAQHLSGVFGQQFVVDNRGGAGGNIGTDAVAKAAPDGYTIGLSTSGPLANNKSLYKAMPYDSDKDLAPVALVGEIPLVIASNPATKVTNLREFVELARGATPPVTMGHPGNGTIGHLAIEGLKARAGIGAQVVPYKGDTALMTDLIGGQVQALSAPVSTFIANIQSGRLTGLAVTSRARFPGLPQVPTALEQGIDLEATVWFAVVGPAGLPAAVVQRLNQEINKYTASAEGRARLSQFGLVEVNAPPQTLGALMRSEAAKWKPLVEAAKISLQ